MTGKEKECLKFGDIAIDIGLLKLKNVFSVTSQLKIPQPEKPAPTSTNQRPKRLKSLILHDTIIHSNEW